MRDASHTRTHPSFCTRCYISTSFLAWAARQCCVRGSRAVQQPDARIAALDLFARRQRLYFPARLYIARAAIFVRRISLCREMIERSCYIAVGDDFCLCDDLDSGVGEFNLVLGVYVWINLFIFLFCVRERRNFCKSINRGDESC